MKSDQFLIKQFEESIKSQKDKGSPKLKNRIARVLQVEYHLGFNEAMELVYSEEIQEKIDNDIEWAQHMGSEFWANEIYENNIINKANFI
ncbi:hypothetical protein JOC75_003386 [Metabacillus crassostreae]|uniref:hypothetical protein n=1 Tax=Metabacillus crassostreae TaxID=929098 RepID=UPI00195C9E4D|nr:hypothetical protein [Metabacillus crassostreae]MBM7605363.1 hypothetical protein [Metabacillus crassostreae]